MAEGNEFTLKIITPDRIFFEGNVNMVEMQASEGEVGIYKDHEPTTMILHPGVLTIHNGGEIKKAALHSGFAEVLSDRISVLAEAAEWPDEIDKDRAERAKERAEERLSEHSDGIDVMRAELSLRRALTRLSLKN